MNIENVMRLVRNNIRSLAPYSTARDEYKGELGVFLDANENPFDNGYNRYPDPRQIKLKTAISQIKAVSIQQLFVGNGSDEAIDLCIRVFCEPRIDNIVTIAPTYGMYSVAANINDVETREVQLGVDFALPKEELLAACDGNTKIIFICSPNNPTGNSFSIIDITYLLENFNGIIVVDEAYIDFASSPGVTPLIQRYPNLIVLQTLSKAYGLAALRLGLAIANEFIIDIFAKVKYPYNINLAGMERAMTLLERNVQSEIMLLKEERMRLEKALAAIPCVKHVFPSDANFILVKVDDAHALYNELISNKVIVRDRSHIRGCEGCLRITVGTPRENSQLLKILENFGK